MREFKTLRFGVLKYDDNDIVYFPKGIPGFEDHKAWLLVGNDESAIKWLQSLKDGDVALPIVPPDFIISDYDPQLCKSDINELKAPIKDLCFFVVVAVPENAPWEATANIRAPIAVNAKERLGKQAIGQREDYDIKHYIFDDSTREKMRSAFAQASSAAPSKGGAS